VIRVFLPAYNEEAALEKVITKFDSILREIGENYSVLVLDDGSTDRTADVAKTLSAKYPLQLMRHEVNKGLGQTMIDGLRRTALDSAPEDLVITLDCDDTHDPKYVTEAIRKIKEGYDLVILSRYQKGGGEIGLSAIKSVLSRGAGIFLKFFFPIKGVKEYSCGYRVFRAGALQNAFRVFGERFVRLPQMGFVVTPEILIKMRMLGSRIAEVPFVLNYDLKPGPSKNKPLKTIMGYFALVALYWGRRQKGSSA
jgi:dolichol-phosphate mannosyltransferase